MNAAAPSNQKYCTKESEELKACLGANKADALVCGEVVKSFEQCVALAVQSAVRFMWHALVDQACCALHVLNRFCCVFLEAS